MPTELLPEYDSHEAVPEPLRDAFAAGADGKFRLSKAVTVETLPEVAGLKRTLDKFKLDYATASGDVTTFKTQISQLQAELDTLKADGGSKGDQKKLQEQIDALKNGHKTELETERSKTTAAIREAEDLLVSVATETAVTASGSDSPVALRPHISAALRVVRGADGKARVEVMDLSKPDRPVLYNMKTGEPMTPSEYAISLGEKKEFKALFPGSGMSGSDSKGSKQTTGGTLGKQQVTRDQLKNAEFFRGLQEIAKQRKVHVTEVYEIIPG